MSGVHVVAHVLRKSFGRTEALRGASLSVAPGEVLALTGPSGSGKSTLLHCLSGVLLPDGGEVRLDGSRLDQLDEDRRTVLRRREIGLVLQSGQLVPELSVAQNVQLPLLLDGRGRGVARAAAQEWVERLGVEDVAGALPGELSGGQAQRVAVARALVMDPRLVCADEPTGALDTVGGEQVLEALLGVTRERGATLVIVTHDNRVAARADRELVVRDGRVERAGVAA